MMEEIDALKRTCPCCGKRYIVYVTKQEKMAWVAGMKVQEVWPDKTPAEREQIITGMCSDKCWNEYLGVDEYDGEEE